ncbi:MAG: class I SAM-dependent RNA methyltransferase [Candidatus Binatus sp.]|uniref:class I SAM-dependent RNA methyltransferase n=1 Tax=Candidatus Binatus sp. TaxID=2811406 RepID=UPI0027206931|nr:class I SAM-dependent RNA methyltransferase [Candidatus Binatus sp.]MDO8430869.1 class I SAM-dependent RNA methyltransferase [Candidatus Binatus sp.]
MPEIEISAMTFGPYGLGHQGGKAVMAPNAVAGDRLDVSIEAERRDYSLAKIRAIVRASPDRRTAPCPYLPRCGGCDWQHIDYAAQVRFKSEMIARELNHALDAAINPADLVAPAPSEFGYRSRIRLKTGPKGLLGFHEANSNAIVPIDSCLVAEPGITMPLHLARSLGKHLDEIEVVRDDARQVLVAYLKKPADAEDLRRASNVLDSDRDLAGIVLRSGAHREIVGDARVIVELEPGLAIDADADLFSQVNRAQNQKLIAAVMAMAAIQPTLPLLDLFCGAGNFSLPAARRGARVTGVDSEAGAISAASRNALRLGFNDAQFIPMKASATAEFLHRARYRPDIVILDPPRTGALDLMEPIVKLKPRMIIYVSCDVTTLARDMRLLTRASYKISSVRAFDFFPNTHHVEIAAQVLLT